MGGAGVFRGLEVALDGGGCLQVAIGNDYAKSDGWWAPFDDDAVAVPKPEFIIPTEVASRVCRSRPGRMLLAPREMTIDKRSELPPSLFPPAVLVSEGNSEVGDARGWWRIRPSGAAEFGEPRLLFDNHDATKPRVGLLTLPLSDSALDLRFLIVPRKVPGDSLVEKLKGFEDLLLAVWKLSAELPRCADGSNHLSLSSGDAARRAPYHTIRLLQELLGDGDSVRGPVIEAWDAIVAEPVNRLRVERPIKPMASAHRPILYGSRGPWTLRDGWSENDNPDGRVRDRVVYRDIDVPQNRLAVRLAHEVRQICETLTQVLGRAKEPKLGELFWVERFTEMATRVIAAPSLEGVNAYGELGLDSPAVQLHAPCQPLLKAWERLHSDLVIDPDLERDLLDPLANAPRLWEYYCFGAVVAEVERRLDSRLGVWKKEMDPGSGAGQDHLRKAVRDATLGPEDLLPEYQGPFEVRFSGSAGWRASVWWATGVCGPNGRPVPELHNKLPIKVYTGQLLTPDILLDVRDQKEGRWLVILDAKYSNLDWTYNGTEKDPDGEGNLLRTAHTYRDAVMHKPPGERTTAARSWSVILHAGEAAGERPLRRDDRDDAEPKTGVGLVPLTPGETQDGSALAAALTEILRPMGILRPT